MLRYAFAFPVPERQIGGVCGGNDLNVCFGAPKWTPGDLEFDMLNPSIREDHGTNQGSRQVRRMKRLMSAC